MEENKILRPSGAAERKDLDDLIFSEESWMASDR